jgi:hypothetical protein
MRSKKGNFAMRLRPVLALSLWLVAGTVLPTGAQLPPRQTFGAPGCASTGTTTSGRPEGHAIVATVKRVDARQGQLEFTTETGSFLLTAPPAEMHNLRVGDQLLICLHEDMDEDKERVAEDRSTAIPEAP